MIIFSSFFEFDFFLQTRNNDKCFFIIYFFLIQKGTQIILFRVIVADQIGITLREDVENFFF